MRWNNPAGKALKKVGGGKAQTGPSQPAAIQFNLNDDLQPVSASQTLEESLTSSAAKKARYENPFNQSVDAFSLRLKPNNTPSNQPAHIEF
jgi:hypothetical protein